MRKLLDCFILFIMDDKQCRAISCRQAGRHVRPSEDWFWRFHCMKQTVFAWHADFLHILSDDKTFGAIARLIIIWPAVVNVETQEFFCVVVFSQNKNTLKSKLIYCMSIADFLKMHTHVTHHVLEKGRLITTSPAVVEVGFSLQDEMSRINTLAYFLRVATSKDRLSNSYV